MIQFPKFTAYYAADVRNTTLEGFINLTSEAMPESGRFMNDADSLIPARIIAISSAMAVRLFVAFALAEPGA